ncbi:sensor histidine kinase [Marinoscillum pacificum]|uniref:sensor histidine kinase n=1 Tax=Marinoscillum pacificum TaxID=392723 RepID=UPI0021576E56|nr:histidine kinase [Marinoscillum pacificum]
MLIRIAFILLSLILLSGTMAQGVEQTINYTTRDGLPSNTVYGIAQDNLGYIWLGTDKGLSRFDGKEFINYTEEDGLLDSEILKFFKDSKGRIWYFTLNGNIGYIYNASLHTVENTGISERIVSITEHKGEIYFTSRTHCFKIEESGKIKIFDWDFYCPSFESNGSRLFLWTKNTIYEVDTTNERLSILKTGEALKSIKSYLSYYREYLISYSGTRSQSNSTIVKYNVKSNAIEKIQMPYEIRNIKVVNDKLNLFTFEGIYEFDPANNSLTLDKTNIWCTDKILDSNNNQWVSTYYNGIFCKNEIINISQTIQSKKLRRVYSTHSDVYLLDDLQKTYILNPNNDLVRIDAIFSPERFIRSKFNHLIIGSHSEISIDNQNYRIPSLGLDTIGNHLIVGAIDSLVIFNIHAKKPTILSTVINKQFGKIRELLIQDSLHYIIRNDGGAHTFNVETEEFSQIKIRTRINNIHKDQNGIIWLATNGSGVYYLDENNKLENINQTNGLSNNFPDKISSIGDDIYLMYADEIDIIRNASNDKLAELKIDHLSGIPGNLIDFSSTDSTILVVTDKGLYSIQPKLSITKNNEPIPLRIEHLTADEIQIKLSKDIEVSLPAGTERIRFKYSAPFFQFGQEAIFRYRISEPDSKNDSWNQTNETFLTFDKLKSGRYTFEVQCRSNISSWSDTQAVSFQLLPYWYEQVWLKWITAFFSSIVIILTIQQIRATILSKKKLKTEKVFAELSAKKAQFKSHFIFNALNSVRNHLLTNELKETDDFLVAYSKLMRKMLDVSNQVLIPLREELELINLYMGLEKMRLRDQFEYDIEIANNVQLDKLKCPAMIMQVFVENAIWHGIMPLSDTGFLSIFITQKKHQYIIRITDDGVGFKSSEINNNRKSWGTQIVNDKINLIKETYDTDIQIEIESNKGVGTSVAISLPINF